MDELGQQHEAVQDPNIRSYLGPLGLIAKRAHNMTITLQAFDLMSPHRWVRRFERLLVMLKRGRRAAIVTVSTARETRALVRPIQAFLNAGECESV